MGWRLSLKIFVVAVICVNLNLLRDGYLQGSQTLSYTLFTAWILLWMNTQWQVQDIIFFFFCVLCVCVFSDAHGWLWPSALLCRHAVPSSSFLCWPTSPWQPLWMLVCSRWVSSQSDVTLTDERSPFFLKFCLWKRHFSLIALQQTRMRTRMMNSVLRCTRTWTWRASKCGWSGVRRVISTDLRAAHTAASVITAWRSVHGQI